MTAKRFAIIAALHGIFDADPSIKEVLVNASGDPSKFPAICIEDPGHDPDVMTEPGATRYAFTPTIEGYVAGGDGLQATQSLNDLYLLVVEKILGDPVLGALVEEINEGSMRVATANLAAQRRMGFALDIPIVFVADRQSPAV